MMPKPSPMNPFEQIELKQSTFTATDQQVCEKVLANTDAVLRDTAVALAEELGISQAALTRFCQRLGYQGYTDFKSALYRYQKLSAMTESPTTTIDSYCQLLSRIPAAMEEADIEGLVKRINGSRLVVSTGMHKSALPAQLLHLNLLKLAIPSAFCPSDQTSAFAQTFTDEDTLVFFSARATTPKEHLELLAENPKENRPYVVLITMNAKHGLKNKVDQTIWLPNYQNQNMEHYLETQVTFMVFVDLLTGAIAQDTSS